MSLVLGIETSCDETSVALLREDGGIVSSVVSSQIDMHRRYGGVVPEIAARAHLTNLPPLLDEALERAGARLATSASSSATAGPGLVGALLVGLAEGRGIALGLGVPFVPVHHIEGHALSPVPRPRRGSGARRSRRASPPSSSRAGTRTSSRSRPGGSSVLARTRDDAAGEAYDKVAKMAGLGYPGGPVVDRLARTRKGRRAVRRPRFKGGSLDLSFSGPQDGGPRAARRPRLRAEHRASPSAARSSPRRTLRGPLRDLLAAFQEAVVAQLEDRLERLLAARPFPLLTVSGGVAANSLLRERLAAWGRPARRRGPPRPARPHLGQRRDGRLRGPPAPPGGRPARGALGPRPLPLAAREPPSPLRDPPRSARLAGGAALPPDPPDL